MPPNGRVLSAWLVGGGGVVLFVAGAMAWSQRAPAGATVATAPAPRQESASPAVEAPTGSDSQVARRAAELAEAQARLERQLEQQARGQAERVAAERQRLAEAKAARATQSAERDRRRHERIQADRRQRAFARAQRDVTVTMYSTPWCGYCKRARAHLKRAGIPFTEHNIDADPDAKARARVLNPRGGVPTFDIDGQVLVGFSRKRFDRVYKGALERRMR